MGPSPDANGDTDRGPLVLEAGEARQATKTRWMRRILTVSLALSVLALAGAWALTAHRMGHAHGGNVRVETPAAHSAPAVAAAAPDAPVAGGGSRGGSP